MSVEEILSYILVVCFSTLVLYFSKRKLSHVGRKRHYWSIGFQYSSDPFHLNPSSAKTYGRSQIPVEAKTLADPFMINHDGTIYLFHEISLKSRPGGKIAVSVYDKECDQWRFDSIVLDEPFHLSYPYIFSEGSDYYMIPEAKQSKAVRLYRSTCFPREWKLEKIILKNKKFVDPCIFLWHNHYYLFVTRKRRLYLYFSDNITQGWQKHPKSPVKKWNYARCAGRIFKYNGNLYRFAQKQTNGYGQGVRVYQILELSPTAYREIPVDDNLLLKPCGDGWAREGMHHIDILQIDENRFFCVFDGKGIC